MAFYPESFITEVAEKNDIVDVVSRYVRLDKQSGNNMFGLCPFHSEKTPSFSVSRSKQIYHCFGCGKGGGVISFIMEIENTGFPDAVEMLAKQAGIPLPETAEDPESSKKARIYKINKDAARFYYECLNSPGGGKAYEYIAKRHLTKKTAMDFGLGYAPDSWSSLRDAMKAKGWSDQELFEAGLVKKGNNGGFYDAFRNRLMFPVIDVKGNVIAFSGRILGDGEPKYLNSPETAVFSKGRNLFSLNLAKKSKKEYFLLTEGNIDVASLYQAGFDSAVASLGTSLTEQQAQLLSRYKSEVVIAYDSDAAGTKATSRAIGLLEKLDVKVRVLRLGDGAKDPDEYLQTKGIESFRKLIEGSEDKIDYRLRTIAEKYDFGRAEQKMEFIAEAERLVARLPSKAERQVYCGELAQMAGGVSGDAVFSDVESLRARLKAGAEKRREQDAVNHTINVRKYSNPASATAEMGIIRLLYLEPALINVKGLPAPGDLTDERLSKIYEHITAKLRRGETVSTATMAALLDSEEMSLLVELTEEPENLADGEETLSDYIAAMKKAAGGKTLEDILREKQEQQKGNKR